MTLLRSEPGVTRSVELEAAPAEVRSWDEALALLRRAPSYLSSVADIERALAPFAEVDKGAISALLARHVAVLMLADVGRIPGDDREKVARFVSDGGVTLTLRSLSLPASIGIDAMSCVP